MMNGSAIRTGACLLWSADPRGSRIDLARQFALRLQLSANTHDFLGRTVLTSGMFICVRWQLQSERESWQTMSR
jgi:hypothetical protein